jgi:methionine-rich copper-binding protein CopC
MKPGTLILLGSGVVKWAVVCIDTHHTQGSYSFSVAGQGS